jgi:energy-coupling factor transporter ATP-binding protein EcfA2
MRLGDLLVRAKLVSAAQVTDALKLQVERGGRLGDHLVAMGAVNQVDLDAFLYRTPAEPRDIAATKIEGNELLGLLMKLIFSSRLETVRQFVDAIKLPTHIVVALVRMGVERKLLQALGIRFGDNPADTKYAFTDEGRRWTIDTLQQSRYTGPAPVTLEEFTDQVNLQKFTNEFVTMERIREALGDLVFEDRVIQKCGPALSSGRAILLYGPPGNGKSSVALRLAGLFNEVIYVPYAITVDGQIIILYDPSIHRPMSAVVEAEEEALLTGSLEDYDPRWVPCQRPFVVTGGELSLDMLDLRYDAVSQIYEAPLHMKVLGGCFVIDDFGRQLVSPAKLLNRWIVPLEGRVDYLRLHTGKTFSIPFDELVIFSTNLEPEDLMDTAFLRRLPYKIEIGAPSLEKYKEIFIRECELHGLTLLDEVFDMIVHKVRIEKGLDLAGFHPKFIVDQVVSTCRFMKQAPSFDPQFIDFAIDNLRVTRKSPVAVRDSEE